MQLQVLFDSQAVNEDLRTGWGVSCLIDGRILFDTGEKEESLLYNVGQLKVDLMRLEDVILSHDHWDHTGGLGGILKQRPGIKVHGCSSFSDKLKENIRHQGGQWIEHKDCAEIRENLYLTGEISTEYKGAYLAEQVLIMHTPSGLVVLTGCAHPGIVSILKRVKKYFSGINIEAVLGGFHLIGQNTRKIQEIVREFRQMGVKKVGPTHCSGTDAQDIFRQEYGENYLDIKVGKVFSFEGGQID